MVELLLALHIRIHQTFVAVAVASAVVVAVASVVVAFAVFVVASWVEVGVLQTLRLTQMTMKREGELPQPIAEPPHKT